MGKVKAIVKAEAYQREMHWYVRVDSLKETLYFLCTGKEDAESRAAILNGMIRDLIDACF